MEQFKKIQWVVQRNLTNLTDFEGMQHACEQLSIPFIPLDIIPFSTELPSFDRSRRTIIYGSTTFNALAREEASLREGIFFDEAQFSIENYFHHWGRYMLNYGARITTFEELIVSNEYPGDKMLFIRPNDDNKSFAGEMKRYDEIRDWYAQLSSVEKFTDGKIVISEPYNIQYEWRLWIVNKQVIAASKYRHYFKLKKEEGCPDSVVAFAQARCEEYTPHDVFVMDICLCGDEYFIVECGGMNAAGFYKARIGDIVKGVSEYFVETWKCYNNGFQTVYLKAFSLLIFKLTTSVFAIFQYCKYHPEY